MVNNMEKEINGIVLEDEIEIGEIELDFMVEKPNLENIEITPSKEEQVFNHPNSDGYDEVRVKGVTSEVDENIVAENIKSDVEILGVKGTFVGAKYKPRFVRFYGYTGDDLTYEVSNLDTSLMIDMSQVFYNCRAKTLDLTSWDVSNATTMKQMFYMSQVQDLNITGWNTSNVTDMSQMFASSYAESLDLRALDTSNVTTMYSMFSYADAKYLDLSTWDTSNVTTMEQMFRYADKLEHLDIRNFTFNKVSGRNYAFSGIPNDCLIIVKSETEKTWILGLNSSLTNVKTVAEYGG